VNWRRGFLRLGILTALILFLPLGGIAYVHWREQQSQPQLVRIVGSSREAHELYEKFVHGAQTAPDGGLAIPDARIISRSAIPTAPTWPFPRPALIFGFMGFVLGVGASWVVAGFRKK